MAKQPLLVVVDDEPMMLQLLSQTLIGQGFQVLEAENGVRAYELVEANPVDLIISDLNMPKMGGVKLIEKLKNSAHKDIPFILMSGDADQVPRSDLHGAIILRKPFRRRELIELLMSILGPLKG